MDTTLLRETSRRLGRTVWAYVSKTPERKWTATGIGIAFVASIIFVPPIGIAAFGGAIAGWWIVVAVVTVIGAFAGNRVGIEMERRQVLRGKHEDPAGGVTLDSNC
ncbi:hypothetical protein GCM10008943_09550 [Paenochrobactrum glaciei]|uniref:Uncharacterized protein n=1 Tax=Paenochrobactrum glaciei TaxID=486407 RepID=A0ABN1FRX2_9HYPH